MAVQSLFTIGAPVLFEVAQPVNLNKTEALSSLFQDLKDTAHHYDGLGISAPQIGRSLRVIFFGFESSKRYPNVAPVTKKLVLNPEFEPLSNNMDTFEEGCLSVPNYRAQIRRYTDIRYWGYDETGKRFEQELTGMTARIVQHEIDHLDGILFPMRAAFDRLTQQR